MRELKIRALLSNLPQALAFVDGELEKLDCPLRTQTQIDIAVEEIFVNIVSYAYAPGEGDALLRVEAAPPGCVSITLVDSGTPYNPLAKPDPDVTLPARDRQIGGLGIYMVKKSMDDLKYEYRDGQNMLTLVKKIT